MDFFSCQEEARRKSRTFFRVFGLAMVGTVVIMYFGFTVMFFLTTGLPEIIYGAPAKVLALRPFLIVTLFITAVILTISYRKVRDIKDQGAAYMAEIMGGELLMEPQNHQESQLINVVEEMAVASGLPRPRLYILRKEWTINAITAGQDYDDTVILVTQGALTHFNRQELQAVMAHEFAHILNGDFSLNLTMAGWLYGLLFIYMKGATLFHWAIGGINNSYGELRSFSSDGHYFDGKGQAYTALFPIVLSLPLAGAGLVLMVCGALAQAAAELVQSAFSRQREYLADAFAVQFTRDTGGLAGALKKIAAYPRRGFIKGQNVAMMKAFFIASPSKANDWFKTHPPLEDRIRVLEPGWDGALPDLKLPDTSDQVNAKYRYGPKYKPFPKPTAQARGSQAEASFHDSWGEALTALAALILVGSPNSSCAAGLDFEAGARIYEALPEPLRLAADKPGQAQALTAAIFIDDEPEIQSRQLELVRRILGPETLLALVELKQLLAEEHKFPLLSLLPPTLMVMEPQERSTLRQAVKALIAADGRLDLFEIAACQILKKHLELKGKKKSANHSGGLQGYVQTIQNDVVLVLSILARLDDEDPEGAFAAGLARFSQWPTLKILEKDECSSGQVLKVLDRIAEAPAKIGQTLMLAAVSTASYGGRVSKKEYYFLKALSATLEIHLPLVKPQS